MELRSITLTTSSHKFDGCVHFIPGRVRLSIAGLRGNPAMADKISRYLSQSQGIKDAQASPVSGRVLLLFEPSKCDVDQVVRQVMSLASQMETNRRAPSSRSRAGSVRYRSDGSHVARQSITHAAPSAKPHAVAPTRPHGARPAGFSVAHPGAQRAALQGRSYGATPRRPLVGQPRRDEARPRRDEAEPKRAEARSGRRVGPSVPWHTMEADGVVTTLRTTPNAGLTASEVQQRLQTYGHNELVSESRPSFVSMLVEPLQGFMSKLLLAAAGVSLLVGESADALAIGVIVGLQAVTEAFQGYRAERSLEALKQLSAPTANVIRDTERKEVPARDLVPGDIVVLETGDRVPADCRILDAKDVMTDEASLTGESIPVAKANTIVKKVDVATGDKENMLWAGSSIMSGRARATVVATGMNTETGRIAALLNDVGAEPTPLQRQMERLGQKITRLVLGSVATITAIGYVRGQPLANLLRNGVSLAVGAIPEGLQAVVTVALALGVQRMARRNAIVRRLPAVETLGGVTVVCTDKTGTLTKNEMTVTDLFCDDTIYSVTGEGYSPSGSIVRQGRRIRPEAERQLLQILMIGVLCNNAELRSEGRVWSVQGDPTEGALLTVAGKAGMRWDQLRQAHCRDHEVAFDPTRRMMSVVCHGPDGKRRIYTKGAPEAVLNCCTRIATSEGMRPLDDHGRKHILEAYESMARDGLRVLAMASKGLRDENGGTTNSIPDDVDLEKGLVFHGLVGMVDPPRPGVKEAIRKCHDAGIKVVMITGDYKTTAEAIGKRLGIQRGGTTVTGEMMNHTTDEELTQLVDEIQIYSRTSPEQKLRIVRALKKRGHIAAMTGDGVNDAPAVKEADVGLAMGRMGTDVTREAADITLSDDNFSTIVAGIEEGRTVGENIAKSLRYILSGNWGQVLAVFLASVTGMPSPLGPTQILWVNLVTEGFPAMALVADPPHKGCMRRPPSLPEQSVFSRASNREIVRRGLLSGLTTFGIYAGGLGLGRWNLAKARTIAFSHLVMNRVFSVLDSSRGGLLKGGNPYILPAAALSTAMLAITMYIPVLRPLFGTVPMDAADWALVGLTSGVLARRHSFLGRWIQGLV